MNTHTILQFCLALHLIALAMTVGITLANAVAFKQFWKLYDKDRDHGLSAFRGITKFQLFGIFGLTLLILTGIIMLWLFQWTLVALLWFKLKMFLAVLLLVNGFTMGRITTLELQKLLSGEKEPGELQPDTTRLRRNLEIFQLTQLLLFILIIIVAVFRFT